MYAWAWDDVLTFCLCSFPCLTNPLCLNCPGIYDLVISLITIQSFTFFPSSSIIHSSQAIKLAQNQIGEIMKTYEQQSNIEYGYIDYMGNKWPDRFIDTYNRYTADINKSAGIPIKPDSLTQKEREFYLNQRHAFFIEVVKMLHN